MARTPKVPYETFPEGIPRHFIRNVWCSGTFTPVDADVIIQWMEGDHPMERPVNIYVHWAPDLVPMERALEFGYNPERKPRNKRRIPVPHFGVGEDGTLFQFVDPSRQGSCAGVSKNMPASETIVISQLAPDRRNIATQQQRATVRELLLVLYRVYGMEEKDVRFDDPWALNSTAMPD